MTRANALFRWLLLNAALSTLTFLCAGTMHLPMLWSYLAVFAAVTCVAAFTVDPELLKERSDPADIGLDSFSGKGISVLFLATVALAALDVGRFHWTRSIVHSTQTIALAFVALFLSLQTWAMAVNPFFSSAIRLQTERGHRVVTHGPYRVIRHPGYFAMVFNMPATAIALGSYVALIPAILCSFIVLRRTLREDRFLREELPGYPAYVMMVRYRLFPGLW
jgi:protein-S-isoprenylcysteine O-methyltransferase Ste14